MLETVAADSPVLRAISAWVSEPGHAHRAYDPLEIGPVQRRLRSRSLHAHPLLPPAAARPLLPADGHAAGARSSTTCEL